jgi:ribonucleoside-diphosphate reductase alpha chain
MSWEQGIKAMAIYRDGSKMSQPLANKSDVKADDEETVNALVASEVEAAVAAATAARDAEIAALKAQLAAAQRQPALPTGQAQLPGMPYKPTRRMLPAKRHGFTQEARIAGHKIYLRTGEYEDGTLGEIFIDMHKEGAAFRSMINSFAIAVSKGLQYGVPLEEYVDTYTFVRFEPQGMVSGHPNIKLATSVIDFVFRVLGMEYLGRTDLVQVADPPHTVDQTGEHADLLPSEDDIVQGVGPSPAQRVASPAAPAIPTTNGNGQQPQHGSSAHRNGTSRARASLGELHVQTQAAQSPASAPVAAPVSAIDAQLGEMMGDAPFCDVCGHITVRNGACYKCLNCGNSLGCS